MEEHAKKCSKELTSCPYSSLGCEAKVLKPQLEHHESTFTVEHLALAVKRINRLEKKLEARNVPPIVFEIEDISSMFYDSWRSPPFYTHSEGYKLYLYVDFRDGSTVSVRVCLMHGEYDEDLTWPFRGEISFEVLNQTEDDNHMQGSAEFLEKKIFKRSGGRVPVPADEGERYVGSGGERLDIDDYISDDTIYIRVSKIELSDSNKPWLIN